ncbi:MAG: DoxX family protein [Ignavibacteriae bacterium]|nr:DoxX family protein [Ignavibacteriota bacterium]
MKHLLFSTGDDWTGLLLRLTVGLVMFPHGAQKLFGWFGGHGFSGTMGFFTQSMQLPWIVAFAVVVIESIGAVLLVTGFATRVWAVAFIGLMAGIVITSHLQNGFFMNWMGAQQGEGFEFHLLVIGLCLALLMTGGGKYSMDQLLLQ